MTGGIGCLKPARWQSTNDDDDISYVRQNTNRFLLNSILSCVYTTQPVGQPVIQQVGSLYTRDSQFANQLPNPLANKLQVCIHGTAGWPTGCTIGWKYVYTTQPVGQPVVRPVGQQVVSTAMNKLNLQIMHRFQWGKGHVKKVMFI